MFDRSTAAPLRALPDHAPVNGSPLRLAEWLVRECWGAYLAILPDPHSGGLFVFPDPSGLLQVFRLETSNHIIVTSDLTLLAAAGLAVPAVSWADLHAYLRWPELRQRSTCLAKVRELEPGVLVSLGHEQAVVRTIWCPDMFMPSREGMAFNDAAEELRELATAVIGAWAGFFGNTAVAASGGVDSSLICAALARAGQAFGCITLSTADPSGDERRFVHRLAEHLHVPAVASIYDAGLVDLDHPASHGLPRPQRKTFLQALDRALGLAGNELGAQVIFDGNGGDNLFCFLHSSAAVVDSLRCRGPGRATLGTFLDMCRLTGCDTGSMARAVMRRALRPPPTGLWAPDERVLAGGSLPGSEVVPLTPWFDAEVGRHLGKRDHLALIMRCQNHLHGLAPASVPRRFSPLMSQPLVELCLSYPTWLWCKGGINRAVARAAFAQDLPQDVVWRTSKSGPDSFIRKLFDDRRSQIRDMLLGGLLASHGLVDREATEAALAVGVESGDSIIYRLLDLAEAEAWARSWTR
ncbi:asparagine synthase C-terminal domain-containing protein [Novosphingobium sp.]|uniref:asparagine synthase C-terminal domain-containing protein n=1 Tax=Novosphingobium sp. TaxID=1874826 RepID=UPI00286DA750|nr:asparagine synthase C-terminal domain-containing protein [Novosphingobium sp.]